MDSTISITGSPVKHLRNREMCCNIHVCMCRKEYDTLRHQSKGNKDAEVKVCLKFVSMKANLCVL